MVGIIIIIYSDMYSYYYELDACACARSRLAFDLQYSVVMQAFNSVTINNIIIIIL